MFHPQGPTFWELARQALSSTERGYDLLAPKFDYTPFRTPDAVLQAVAHQLRDLGPFGAALDLCCGTGAAMRMLRPLCRQRVVGVDVSRGMLEVARRRLTDAPGNAPLELVRGDVRALPFGQTFDIATCFGALGHILVGDEPRFVAEVGRVLRPGGRFVFVTSYPPPRWSVNYWLARLFNGAMHVRNFLISPPFIMYYLTFLLPETARLLEAHGLAVQERALMGERHRSRLRLVIAERAA
jgi:ubiquinone/menaquinone biosynthesis C-methylase UbiE